MSMGIPDDRHLPLTSISLVRICIGCGGESEFIRMANGYPIGQCGPCAAAWLEMLWSETDNGLAGNAEAMLKQLRLFG